MAFAQAALLIAGKPNRARCGVRRIGAQIDDSSVPCDPRQQFADNPLSRGGHKARAAELVESAIYEVQQGINVAARRGDG